MELSQVLLPSMGEGINEATLVKWLKKVGENVEKDEPLLEVSTDKVDTEIPSPASGIFLQAVASEGMTVEVNSTIAWIGPQGATIPKLTETTSGLQGMKRRSQDQVGQGTTQISAPTNSANIPKNAGHVPSLIARGGDFEELTLKRSSPLVRKMAFDYGIDLRRVIGTGANGRITKHDMDRFLASPGAFAEPVSAMNTFAVASDPLLAKVSTKVVDGKETLEGVPVKREKMSKMRRLIAEHMVESVRHSPHVTTTFEIDLNNVVLVRDKCKKAFADKYGFNLTFTHILIRAAVLAIQRHPIVNVSVDGDEILWKDQINVGCAVALGNEGGGGLIVPVIKNAQTLSLTDIALKLTDLATRARSKKLAADEVVGGTFSVTNPGGWGSIHSNPIINQPQVAMLGIGAIVKRPVVIDNDKIVVRPMMMASLTFDHRVIDGEGGAMWLATYKEILENWTEIPSL
ncbi:MAG: dihydrolipoamide acetyltransferase family protein [Proteobacteria bacterium]|nr:dihydrolipoamide acetyltransferase family protein [Pseudomonadota bacterium]